MTPWSGSMGPTHSTAWGLREISPATQVRRTAEPGYSPLAGSPATPQRGRVGTLHEGVQSGVRNVDHQTHRVGEEGGAVARFVRGAEAQRDLTLEVFQHADLGQAREPGLDVANAAVGGVDVRAADDDQDAVVPG